LKTVNPIARPVSPSRKALAEQLAHVAELRARKTGDAEEHARLQQLLSAAIAKRDELIADVLIDDELPRRIGAYQDLVLKVNATWNEILAFDDMMRRRFPVRASIFNTVGPHERAVVAPSTDRSPLPPLHVDARRMFAAANDAAERLVEALASDAHAKPGRS
jgi:hypothetical protein